MGGPSARVLLASEFELPLFAEIDALLDQIGVRPEDENTRRFLDLWVDDTLSIGGTYCGEGRPLSVTPHRLNPPDGEYDLQKREIGEIRAQFDLKPEFVIDIGANCNQAADHQILAEVCHHLASEFDGIIDFNGAVFPSCLHAVLPIGMAPWEAEWPDLEGRFSEWASGLPGRIVSIPYTTAWGRTWVCHYCTPEFLKAWMNQPEFHMIK